MQEERSSQTPLQWTGQFFRPLIEEEELRAFLTARFGRDMADVPPDSCLAELLGLDSLEELELMAALEKAIGVSFSTDQLARPKSIGGILEALEELSADVPS